MSVDWMPHAAILLSIGIENLSLLAGIAYIVLMIVLLAFALASLHGAFFGELSGFECIVVILGIILASAAGALVIGVIDKVVGFIYEYFLYIFGILVVIGVVIWRGIAKEAKLNAEREKRMRQERSQREREQRERAQREQEEQEQRERVQREQEERAQRQRARREQAEREQQERAQREQEEQEQRERVQREQEERAQRQRARREQAEREQRERAQRDRGERERPKGRQVTATEYAVALEMLGLKDHPTASEAKAAWKALMAKVHPDKGGTSRLAAEVNSSYQKVRDYHGW
ncbi:DnaJ family molecular chaperone [Azospirillum picis]|uniref:J domain-containing protein n=1 Tax=Azospirillum picis TaxID=488438 RepID=UPI003615174B